MLQYIKFIFLFFLFTCYTFADTITLDSIRAQIHNTLSNHLKGSNQHIVRQIYLSSGNTPLWINAKNRTKSKALIAALNNPLFNYKNKSFDRKSIKKLFYYLDNNNLTLPHKVAVYARLDVILTNSFVRLIRFIVQGDVDWQLVHKKLLGLKESDDIKAHWEISVKPMPSIQSISNAIISGDIYPYLKSLIPMESRYTKLIKLLKKYRAMGKFPKVLYYGKTNKLGQSNKSIPFIKKRLKLSGDYPKGASMNSKFNKTLKQAVIRFQKRYLLKITGEVDSTTIYYLNKPLHEHIQAIITNLDKTKIYPKSFENEYIEVNIPDFHLRYYKNNHKIMKMDLIVGRIDRPTPLFNSAVRYMVLNPTWTIPDNLIKRDLIHVLEENPMYLKENNIHVFSGNKEVQITHDTIASYENSSRRVPYRFVQFPGENNALGRVKFMFPNRYAVYLHDTDNKTLFNRRYKVYSSGCMRVSKPFKLMHTLLSHTTGYSPDKLESIFRTNKPYTIKLARPIPVHILYFTVYEENGLAYFKYDIYLYDKIIEESVEGHKKPTFTIPSKRMIKIKKKDEKPLSN